MTITNAAAIFSAVAALAAALLSGMTLYITGKREERRWRRDILLETYQRFIALSFERSLLAVQAIDTRRSAAAFDLDELKEREVRFHAEYDGLIARLRLLAAKEVIEAAEVLHVHDNELIDMGMTTDATASDADFNAFEAEREQNRRAKESMLKAARTTLGLDAVAVIHDRNWARSPTE